MTDAQHNVTAMVAENGQVVERYAYDPYGRVLVLNGENDPDGAEYTPDADGLSDVGNVILYAGYRFDAATGLYQVRRRYHHPTLGRWINRDPKGYVDGMNLYQYVASRPMAATDPMGTESDSQRYARKILPQREAEVKAVEGKMHPIEYELWYYSNNEEAAKRDAVKVAKLKRKLAFHQKMLGNRKSALARCKEVAEHGAQEPIGSAGPPSLFEGVGTMAADFGLGLFDVVSGIVMGAVESTPTNVVNREVTSLFTTGETTIVRKFRKDVAGYKAGGEDGFGACSKAIICQVPFMNIVPAGVEAFTGKSAHSQDYKQPISGRRRSAQVISVGIYVVGTTKCALRVFPKTAVPAAPSSGPQFKTWNQFQAGTKGQFASRADAGRAWAAYKQANGIVTGSVRSSAARSRFLKSLVDDYRTPSSMKQWLRQGKVPPGYEVDHIKPLSIGGPDTPANMGLQLKVLHDLHHAPGFYRPWE